MTFSHPGDYEIRLSLVDLDTDDVLVAETISVSVAKPRTTTTRRSRESPATNEGDAGADADAGADPAERYPDINEHHWAGSAIQELSIRGILHGYPDGTFGPNRPITRFEASKVFALLLSLLDIEPDLDSSNSEDWAQIYVDAVIEAGIMQGRGSSLAGDEPVTRAEIAVILGRNLGGAPQKPEVLNQFADHKDIPDWARDGFAIAVAHGFFQGYPDGSLQPNVGITRAELAVILLRLLMTQL